MAVGPDPGPAPTHRSPWTDGKTWVALVNLVLGPPAVVFAVLIVHFAFKHQVDRSWTRFALDAVLFILPAVVAFKSCMTLPGQSGSLRLTAAWCAAGATLVLTIPYSFIIACAAFRSCI